MLRWCGTREYLHLHIYGTQREEMSGLEMSTDAGDKRTDTALTGDSATAFAEGYSAEGGGEPHLHHIGNLAC